jgi:hypothetical protein
MKKINTTDTASKIELNSINILIESIIDELIENNLLDRNSFNKRVNSKLENSMYVGAILDIKNNIDYTSKEFLNINVIGES